MSCLPDCSFSKSTIDTDSSVCQPTHDESSYQPLSEASCLSEAIPLLPKDSTMIKYESDAHHYELLSVIGKGMIQAAVVSLARHVPSGQHVAVKRINLEKCTHDLTYVQREILVTKQLHHKNLLPYLCSFVCDNEVWVVMPVMVYGSAKDIIKSRFSAGLPEVAIAFIMKDVLSALEYIHKRGLIHRSVKASHILVSSTGKAVLSGLRYSCNVIEDGRWHQTIHQFPADSGSNLSWLSPEVLEQNLLGYNYKSDIYSLGVCSCELANGVVPYADMPPTQMLLEKLQGYPPVPLDARSCDVGEEPTETANEYVSVENTYKSRLFSEAFHSFTSLCLEKDPFRRPITSQLSQHAFIKQCKKTSTTLLDLLATVTPHVDVPSLPQDNSGVENAAGQFEDLELDDTWIF